MNQKVAGEKCGFLWTVRPSFFRLEDWGHWDFAVNTRYKERVPNRRADALSIFSADSGNFSCEFPQIAEPYRSWIL
jgi:hypothetical protein